MRYYYASGQFSILKSPLQEGEQSSSRILTPAEVSPRTSISNDPAWSSKRQSSSATSGTSLTTPYQNYDSRYPLHVTNFPEKVSLESSGTTKSEPWQSFYRRSTRHRPNKFQYASLLCEFPEAYAHPAGPIAGFPGADTANASNTRKSSNLEAKTAKHGTAIAMPDESTAVKHNYACSMADYKTRNMIVSNSPEIIRLPAGPTNRDTFGPAFKPKNGKQKTMLGSGSLDQPQRGKVISLPELPEDSDKCNTTYKFRPGESYVVRNMLLDHYPEMVAKPKGPTGMAFVASPILGSKTVNILGMELPEDECAKRRREGMATDGRFKGMDNVEGPPQKEHDEYRASIDTSREGAGALIQSMRMGDVLHIRTASIVSLRHAGSASIITLERRSGSGSALASRSGSASAETFSTEERGAPERLTPSPVMPGVQEIPEVEGQADVPDVEAVPALSEGSLSSLSSIASGLSYATRDDQAFSMEAGHRRREGGRNATTTTTT